MAAVDAHTVHALDADTGKAAWSYTAGGRVDSPPTIYRGRVLFGSADGWVYCLRAGDGRLAWRFRAAPEDRRLVAYEQLESAWPVSGSVLVQGDVVCCVAGRSAFLDGGMRLVRLDAASGRQFSPRRGSTTATRNRQKSAVARSRGRTCPWPCPTSSPATAAPSTCGPRRSTWRACGGTSRRRDSTRAAGNRGLGQPPLLAFRLPRRLLVLPVLLDLTAKTSTATTAAGSGPGHSCPLRPAAGVRRRLRLRLRPQTGVSLQRLGAAVLCLRRPTARSGPKAVAARGRGRAKDQRGLADWTGGSPPTGPPARSSPVGPKCRRTITGPRKIRHSGAGHGVGRPDAVSRRPAGDRRRGRGLAQPDDPAIKAKLVAQAAALRGAMGGQLLAISATDGRLQAAHDFGRRADLRRHGRRRWPTLLDHPRRPGALPGRRRPSLALDTARPQAVGHERAALAGKPARALSRR